MEVPAALALTLLVSLCVSVAQSSTLTIRNNCPFTVWPATSTRIFPTQLSSTGFELPPEANFTLGTPIPWLGKVWGRSQCSTDSSGKFTCATGDCSSGQITCNGANAIQPASLAEFALYQYDGKDYYDISVVDGFNLPLSLTVHNSISGNCTPISCPGNVNAVCPPELAVKGSDGSIVACKGACLAFNTPQNCCTGEYFGPNNCKPSEYSKIFKRQCPQAYSYAYDNQTSPFTCPAGSNYVITFCP